MMTRYEAQTKLFWTVWLVLMGIALVAVLAHVRADGNVAPRFGREPDQIIRNYPGGVVPGGPSGASPLRVVARAIDGDSIEEGNRHIRLFGIDAPEYNQMCNGV